MKRRIECQMESINRSIVWLMTKDDYLSGYAPWRPHYLDAIEPEQFWSFERRTLAEQLVLITPPDQLMSRMHAFEDLRAFEMKTYGCLQQPDHMYIQGEPTQQAKDALAAIVKMIRAKKVRARCRIDRIMPVGREWGHPATMRGRDAERLCIIKDNSTGRCEVSSKGRKYLISDVIVDLAAVRRASPRGGKSRKTVQPNANHPLPA